MADVRLAAQALLDAWDHRRTLVVETDADVVAYAKATDAVGELFEALRAALEALPDG